MTNLTRLQFKFELFLDRQSKIKVTSDLFGYGEELYRGSDRKFYRGGKLKTPVSVTVP